MTSETESPAAPRRRLSCAACFDALWFCYSPVHQLQQYYRVGVLDNCSSKWSALVDCLALKTKSASKVEEHCSGSAFVAHCNVACWQWFLGMISNAIVSPITGDEPPEILGAREKAKPHIWTFRTPEEAASHWQKQFGHLDRP